MRSVLQAEPWLCYPAQWDLPRCSNRRRRRCQCWLLGAACCFGGSRSGRADRSGCRPCCGGGGHRFCCGCGGGCGNVCLGCASGWDPKISAWYGVCMVHDWGRTSGCAEDGWWKGSAGG